MKTFRVQVVKTQRVFGYVEIEADSWEKAEADVKARMNNPMKPMQTTEPVWDNPEYVDFSFDTTGEVEEA